MKVEISICRTKSGQQLCSTNVNFDQYRVGKKSNKTLIEHNCCPDLVRLMLISTFLCTEKGPKNDLSSIVELNQNNCQRKNRLTSHLLRYRPLNNVLELEKNGTNGTQHL